MPGSRAWRRRICGSPSAIATTCLAVRQKSGGGLVWLAGALRPAEPRPATAGDSAFADAAPARSESVARTATKKAGTVRDECDLLRGRVRTRASSAGQRPAWAPKGALVL